MSLTSDAVPTGRWRVNTVPLPGAEPAEGASHDVLEVERHRLYRP